LALETLKDVKEIDGFEVDAEYNSWTDLSLSEIHGDQHIMLDHDTNFIVFKLQKGPVKENGVNGCQVDTLIEAARQIIAKLNENHPCEENVYVLGHLDNALVALHDRKIDREARGVEGTDAP
jgi:hypothetical protein